MDRHAISARLLFSTLLLLAPGVVRATEPSDGPFVAHGISIEGRVGPYFSPTGIGPDHPDFDFVRIGARIGFMLNAASKWSGPLRGNFEALFEVAGGPTFDGFGDWLVGPTGWIRYNFVQPGWRVVPYVQGGLGIDSATPIRTSSRTRSAPTPSSACRRRSGCTCCSMRTGRSIWKAATSTSRMPGSRVATTASTHSVRAWVSRTSSIRPHETRRSAAPRYAGASS